MEDHRVCLGEGEEGVRLIEEEDEGDEVVVEK